MKFKNKVVWITGASSGIGEALVYSFNREGANVILSSHEDDELARVAQNCTDKGETYILPLDLSQTDTLAYKAEDALNKFGHIDILINNGGISQRAYVKDTDFEIYRKIMDIDFFGHVAITKAVLPSMLERKSGHIVVTSSLAGKFGIPLRSGYCAAKHALHGFFDALRVEVWRENVNVTIICPSAVTTNISKNAVLGDGSKYEKMDDLTARGLTPDECAKDIIDAIIKEKEEVTLRGDYSKYAVYVKRLSPTLLSKIIRKVKVT